MMLDPLLKDEVLAFKALISQGKSQALLLSNNEEGV
jgi:hypothetical protein